MGPTPGARWAEPPDNDSPKTKAPHAVGAQGGGIGKPKARRRRPVMAKDRKHYGNGEPLNGCGQSGWVRLLHICISSEFALSGEGKPRV